MTRSLTHALLLATCASLAVMQNAGAQTLAKVQKAGTLSCGVITEPGDYTKDDTHGDTSAFGSDFCKAVSAAILGNHAHASIQGFPDAATAYTALHAGKIDLIAGVSPVPGVAKHYEAAYAQPIFFDGQGFLVNKSSGIASSKDLAGKTLCFIGNTDAETSATEALSAQGVHFNPFPFEEMGEMEAALVSGHCAAETHDLTTLAEGRSKFHARIKDYAILPETITLDPLVPAVRAGDTEWIAVIDWTTHALVQAEINGITQANAEQRSHGNDITVNTLLGSRRGLGTTLGLPNDWAMNAIKAVGNYGEMFARDMGDASPMGLPRGVNRPWTQGGLLWTPPFR